MERKYLSLSKLSHFLDLLNNSIDKKINAKKLETLLSCYPVGSIYISTMATNPQLLFGGTWEQIKDVFLLGAGSLYSAGSTGGEATHTLTIQEMPSHKHIWNGRNSGQLAKEGYGQGNTYNYALEGKDPIGYNDASGIQFSGGGGVAQQLASLLGCVYVEEDILEEIDWIWWSDMIRKYVSLSKLSHFLDKIKENFASINHTHKLSELTDDINGLIPSGVIMIWSGNINNIPIGWTLCNGANNTPDLRDKFVLGVGNNYNVGDTGGTENNILHEVNMPQRVVMSIQNTTGTDVQTSGTLDWTSRLVEKNKYIGTCLYDSVRANLNSEYIEYEAPIDNMPPYYALCYIMKV